MPKAEVGSTKWVANKSKAKGLQRLRWYCQVCSKQCRDENGFKQHTLSEGHVRQMLLVGENPGKYINNYSAQFKKDFLQLLRTSHGEKKIHINHFYQEYIRDKEHVHMNATKWQSLTEFAKFLGREGICRVEEGERGLEIAWIDNSPEALKRRDDVKNKERLAKGDEDMESRMLAQQIRKAKEQAKQQAQQEVTVVAAPASEAPELPAELADTQPIKISLSLAKTSAPAEPSMAQGDQQVAEAPETDTTKDETTEKAVVQAPKISLPKFSLPSLSAKPKSNAPSLSKPRTISSPFGKPDAKDKSATGPAEKKMSNAERIMKEELERKRQMQERGSHNNFKRARYE